MTACMPAPQQDSCQREPAPLASQRGPVAPHSVAPDAGRCPAREARCAAAAAAEVARAAGTSLA